jgi:hypothetical protein
LINEERKTVEELRIDTDGSEKIRDVTDEDTF